MTILRAHSDETVSNRKFIETLELYDTFILYGEGAKIIPWRICGIWICRFNRDNWSYPRPNNGCESGTRDIKLLFA